MNEYKWTQADRTPYEDLEARVKGEAETDDGTLVIFKVREKDKSWERSKVILRKAFKENEIGQINYAAEVISEVFDAEVRWNWDESFQGHYIISPIVYQNRSLK